MLTYIFFASFIGLFLLVTLKIIETKKEERLRLLVAISAADIYLDAKYSLVRTKFSEILKLGFDFVSIEIPRKTLSLVADILNFVKSRYNSILLDVRGYRNIKSDAKVSEFLKRISAHKRASRGGRIDESLQGVELE